VVEVGVTQLVVTSASNGDGYDAILSFDSERELLGPFSGDQRIVDPRGLSLDPSGALIYLNSGDDRVLALDRLGYVVRDSGRISGLDPGGGTFGPDGCSTSHGPRVDDIGDVRRSPRSSRAASA
jgi:hypothetical protein